MNLYDGHTLALCVRDSVIDTCVGPVLSIRSRDPPTHHVDFAIWYPGVL